MNVQALASNAAALRRGVHLDISSFDQNTGLKISISEISTSYLSNLPPPCFLGILILPQKHSIARAKRSLVFVLPEFGDPIHGVPSPSPMFKDSASSIAHWGAPGPLSPPVFNPSSFPAIEILAVECDTDVLYFLSALLPNPSALLSLKTFNCVSSPKNLT